MMRTEYLGQTVYEDEYATYCPECYESAGTKTEIEEIPLQDLEGYFGTLLKCPFCDWEANVDDENSSADGSIPNQQYAYQALLQHDYLPGRSWYRDELPPCFSTKLLTPRIADSLLGNTEPRTSDSIAYRITRHANSTRLLTVPHPEPYARLCREIVDSWDEIMELISDNAESRIVPGMSTDEKMISLGSYDAREDANEGQPRVIIQRHPPSQRRAAAERLDLAIGKRYLVSADIAAFFPSVYTHAIPWAVHGKEFAKDNRGDEHYGNRIDKRSRFMQRGETVGIPVGPGTSHILSELLLHPVDAALRDKGYTFIRFIDDYRCYCDSKRQADTFVVDLEDQLAKYSLQLNSSKTSITSLPATRDDPWVIQLRTQLAEMELSGPSSVGSLFDLAINLQAKWRNRNVVKYAARTLAGRAEAGEQMKRCARHVLEIAFHYPSVMPILADLVQQDHSAVRVDEIEHLLERQLQERAPSDALCWTLFAWRQLTYGRGTLPSSLVNGIVETRDCMAIASLWAIGQAKNRVIDFVSDFDPGGDGRACDRYWLLIHEVGDEAEGTQRYREETGLQLLADEKVSFIDRSVFTEIKFEPL